MRKVAIFGGIVIGVTIAAGILPGGYDAMHYFLRGWFPGATVPAWAYIITGAFGVLPYPASWMLFAAFSVAAMFAAAHYLENEWVVLLSPPVIWSLWLGQVEALAIIGAVLAYAIVRGQSAWLGGLALLLLLVKPQIGLFVALWLLWHIWQREQVRGLLKATIHAAIVVVITTLIWPGWFLLWLDTTASFPAILATDNVSLFGLLAFAAVVPRLNHKQQLTAALALMLVIAPYARLYHMAVLLVISGSRLLLIGSWLVFGFWMATGIAWPAILLPVLALTEALRNEGGMANAYSGR